MLDGSSRMWHLRHCQRNLPTESKFTTLGHPLFVINRPKATKNHSQETETPIGTMTIGEYTSQEESKINKMRSSAKLSCNQNLPNRAEDTMTNKLRKSVVQT